MRTLVPTPAPRCQVSAHAKRQILHTDGISAPHDVVSTGSGTAEVVASQRQQKQAQAAAATPPPPAKLGKQPVAPFSSVPALDWVGHPPPGSHLEVQKGGEPVQQIELNTLCTLFGRWYIFCTACQILLRPFWQMVHSVCAACHMLLRTDQTLHVMQKCNADVVLNHASTSRQLPLVGFQCESNK